MSPDEIYAIAQMQGEFYFSRGVHYNLGCPEHLEFREVLDPLQSQIEEQLKVQANCGEFPPPCVGSPVWWQLVLREIDRPIPEAMKEHWNNVFRGSSWEY